MVFMVALIMTFLSVLVDHLSNNRHISSHPFWLILQIGRYHKFYPGIIAESFPNQAVVCWPVHYISIHCYFTATKDFCIDNLDPDAAWLCYEYDQICRQLLSEFSEPPLTALFCDSYSIFFSCFHRNLRKTIDFLIVIFF
jgi:hypothetical protein